MKISLCQFVIIILLLFIPTHCKLLYATSVFRHGARYPISDDIYDSNQTKPFHGQLTSIGIRQQYLLGNYLKSDYIDKLSFLNSTLNPRYIYAFSDSSYRCQYSAAAHLAGMFPLASGAVIPEGIDPKLLLPPYDSVSILEHYRISYLQVAPQLSLVAAYCALNECAQSVPIKNGSVYFPSCPNYANILARRGYSLAKTFAYFQVEQAAFTYKMRLTFNLSTKLSNLAGLAELYDVVICDLYLGRPMPAAFTDNDYRQLRFIQSYLFTSLYGGYVSKIYSTPIVTSILNKMYQIVSGSTNAKKLTILSGHDTNLVPLITFFNLSSPYCIRKRFRNYTITYNCAIVVPFASNFVFELHNIDAQDGFYVKIRYNGDYYSLCGKNSTECSYEYFIHRVKQDIVDYKKYCGIK